jgi:nitrite reductase (NO-forming)
MKIESSSPMALGGRSRWHITANAPVVGWLITLFGITLTHRYVPMPTWLLVHLLLLGAITNAIFVWSAHFSDALLRRRVTIRSRRWQGLRLIALNLGIIAVITGVVSTHWIITLIGSIAVGIAVLLHGITLALQMRSALASRFGATVRYYVCASLALSMGAGLGATLAHHPDEPWHGRWVIAHAALNLLGWIGLTVMGTLVTLWPTMLRTQIAEGAERVARQALPTLVISIALTVTGALLGIQSLAAVGAAGYLGGVLWALRPLVQATRKKAPSAYATWSVMSALIWLIGSLLDLVIVLTISPTWQVVIDRLGFLVIPLVAGFAAQVLLGAFSYLVPVVLGGGPTAARGTQSRLDRGGAARIVFINVGLVICILPVPSLVRVLVSILVLGGFAAFLPLLASALLYVRHIKGDLDFALTASIPTNRHIPESDTAVRQRNTGLVAFALASIVLAVAGGVALDPAVIGNEVAASAGVVATGATTTVNVVARHMRFLPASVNVPAGNQLVLVVTNQDPDVHDLTLETGQATGRIIRGRTVRLDVGIVGRNLKGWCSIVGHRQMGMLFAVNAIGGKGNSLAQANSAENLRSAAADLNFMTSPPAGFIAHNASVPALTPARIHRITMRVKEVEREVAVGVRQRLWTFNGTAPGPTLHGRVGDIFEVTLINGGTISHSIDFHAGELAPSGPTQSVEPGKSLSFRFTATHSGIWLYHCSSMPMSAHIANGMFGAVIIDPPGLPKVAHEYVLEQSELYLGPQGGSVDVAKVTSEKSDAVVFNGFANQYDFAPLRAKVGERVRIWVLAAGPNHGTSFHIVGGQFDTVFSEGAWLLRRGNALLGGSQILALGTGQGGFVELAFPEAGRYPFISHVMVDAEHGAHGFFNITP